MVMVVGNIYRHHHIYWWNSIRNYLLLYLLESWPCSFIVLFYLRQQRNWLRMVNFHLPWLIPSIHYWRVGLFELWARLLRNTICLLNLLGNLCRRTPLLIWQLRYFLQVFDSLVIFLSWFWRGITCLRFVSTSTDERLPAFVNTSLNCWVSMRWHLSFGFQLSILLFLSFFALMLIILALVMFCWGCELG